MNREQLTPEMAADVRQAVEVLKKGGVILYPTDTIWGLGCDAGCAEAVRRIFGIKQRADSKALITLVDSVAALERTVAEVPEVAYQLIDVAVDPLTIIYDGAAPGTLAKELLAEDGSVGVRVTSEAISQAICRGLRRPLVSTSANISGEPSPTCFGEIPEAILKAVDYVCTSRRDEIPGRSKPSSIIKVGAGGLIKVIR